MNPKFGIVSDGKSSSVKYDIKTYLKNKLKNKIKYLDV